jgi:hypothetical protein
VVVPSVELAGLTVKTAVLLDTQLTVRPVRVLLLPSFVVAASGSLPPNTIGVVKAESVTEETGMTVTVTADDPVFVSLVAVIVTGPPAATPETKPFESTVAVTGLLDAQVTVRPVSTVPFKSVRVGVSCCVPPTTSVAEPGLSVTALTGACVTVIADTPVFVSLVAVIVVEPELTAVTKPLASTVAAAGLLELHATARSVTTLPFASLVTTVSCFVGVTPSTRPTVSGVTVTVATGKGLTVIAMVEVFPPADALAVATPGLMAVTTPVDVIDATVGSELDQVTTRLERTTPPLEVTVAANCSDPPTTRDVAPFTIPGPLIWIAATGSGRRIA